MSESLFKSKEPKSERSFFFFNIIFALNASKGLA
jgi:hypothetical protein